MLTGFRGYLGYRRDTLGGDTRAARRRRFRQGIEANFQDAAERARADQEYRAGSLTGRTRDRPRQR